MTDRFYITLLEKERSINTGSKTGAEAIVGNPVEFFYRVFLTIPNTSP